jgi:hypothetical protein
MSDVLEKLIDIGKIDSKPKLEGKMLTCFLVPDKNKILSYNAKLAKEKKKEEMIKQGVTVPDDDVKAETKTEAIKEETKTETEN